MSDDGLEVVLRFTAEDLADLLSDVAVGFEAARATEARLDAIADRSARLRRQVEELAARSGIDPVIPRLYAPPIDPPAGGNAPLRHFEWDQLVERAQTGLIGRGVDLDTVDLDDLLDRGEVDRIERRFTAGFAVSASLDRHDLAAAIVAGVLGALIDVLVVRVPAKTLWQGDWYQGSTLTSALRSQAVAHDNWLSSFARVPFDKVVGTGIYGMSPMTHRVQTFGHDPLLGLALGTIDIMKGSLTAVDGLGRMAVVTSNEFRVANPVLALGLEVLHLLSDVVTRRGLPLPGWTALLMIDAGSIGPAELSIGQAARGMNLRGYDSWHFLTMATSVGAVEATTRAYFGLRQHYDEEYRADVEAEGARVLSERVSDHPRYQAISLLAHTVATTGNLGKFALAGGNPLTLNYPQWLMLAKRLMASLDRPRAAASMQAQAEHNRIVLDTGWAKVGMNPGGLFET